MLISAALYLLLVTGAPSNQGCLACHGEAGMKSDTGRSLYVDAAKHAASVHGELGCTTCHAGVKEYPHPKPMPRVSCASCHDDQASQVPKSVHGILGKASCASCHGSEHEVQAAAKVVPGQCATCHEDAAHGYDASVHAVARKGGDMQTPTCLSCHGGPHQMVASSDPKSPVNHLNIPTTCATCHGQKFVMERDGLTTQPFLAYQESVHGRAVASGSTTAAVCTDCHGVHEILPASNPKSSIFKFNVPATCAKCHEPVRQQFMQSIHGQAIARGNGQAPVCTDCHGIHSIKSHLDPNSPVSAQNLALVTCARCHEGVLLFAPQNRFSPPDNQVVQNHAADHHHDHAQIKLPYPAHRDAAGIGRKRRIYVYLRGYKLFGYTRVTLPAGLHQIRLVDGRPRITRRQNIVDPVAARAVGHNLRA